MNMETKINFLSFVFRITCQKKKKEEHNFAWKISPFAGVTIISQREVYQ